MKDLPQLISADVTECDDGVESFPDAPGEHVQIRHCCRIGVDPDERASVVIIGDREHDILAAHEASIASIGVRWGYAEPGELEAAAPAAIASSVGVLAQLLKGNVWTNRA